MESNKPEFNIELLKTYLDHLVEKFESLSNDPFGSKARLTLRREIENIKSIIEEKQMDHTWKQLSQVFGMEEPTRRPTNIGLDQEEEDLSFKHKAKMNAIMDSDF